MQITAADALIVAKSTLKIEHISSTAAA